MIRLELCTICFLRFMVEILILKREKKTEKTENQKGFDIHFLPSISNHPQLLLSCSDHHGLFRRNHIWKLHSFLPSVPFCILSGKGFLWMALPRCRSSGSLFYDSHQEGKRRKVRLDQIFHLDSLVEHDSFLGDKSGRLSRHQPFSLYKAWNLCC